MLTSYVESTVYSLPVAAFFVFYASLCDQLGLPAPLPSPPENDARREAFFLTAQQGHHEGRDEQLAPVALSPALQPSDQERTRHIDKRAWRKQAGGRARQKGGEQAQKYRYDTGLNIVGKRMTGT